MLSTCVVVLHLIGGGTIAVDGYLIMSITSTPAGNVVIYAPEYTSNDTKEVLVLDGRKHLREEIASCQKK